MIEYECPICLSIFYDKVEVWDHFDRSHPVEWESIRMVKKLLSLFDQIGWPA